MRPGAKCIMLAAEVVKWVRAEELFYNQDLKTGGGLTDISHHVFTSSREINYFPIK